MSALPPHDELLVFGLGAPHDDLVAAACRPFAAGARTAGPLDTAAEARGREALPRGACAPLLFTTGALLRVAAERSAPGQTPAQPTESAPAPLAVLSLGSCGPCRYALFEMAWQRALLSEGRAPIRVVGPANSGPSLHAWLDTPLGARLLEAIAAADALVLSRNRALPRAKHTAEVEHALVAATAQVCAATAAGAAPLDALEAVRGWERAVRAGTARVIARVRLIGDPWSVHANGDGQLCLPSVLAPLGVEVMAPPALLWLRYSVWLGRGEPWGREAPVTAAQSAALAALDARIVATWKSACAALDLEPTELPDPAWLAQLAAPFLPPTLRGGYGHVEIGLARDAVLASSAHAVISVKSFGCMPSSGVSDAIVGAALEDALPFLPLEVCPDGHAARESRLALLAAEALRRATRGPDRFRERPPT